MSLCLVELVTKTPAGLDERGGPNGRQNNPGLCVKEMKGTSVSSAYSQQRKLSSMTADFPDNSCAK